MSSRHNGDSEDPQPKRLIYEKKAQLQQIRDRFWEEGVEGRFNPRTKRYIATVALQFWDVLYEYRDESVLSEGDFPDISPVRERIGRMTEQTTRSNRRTGELTVTQVPAIDELDDWYLIELTEQLDDLAKKLGFAAKADSGKGDMYAVKRDPDDYKEPVSDDIPKPE
jgi:hypothetical protein